MPTQENYLELAEAARKERADAGVYVSYIGAAQQASGPDEQIRLLREAALAAAELKKPIDRYIAGRFIQDQAPGRTYNHQGLEDVVKPLLASMQRDAHATA